MVSFTINVYAVAWGIVVYNFISLFINLEPCKRLVNYGLIEQVKDILPTLAASIIMGCVVFAIGFIPWHTFVILLIQLILGTLVYWMLCRLFHLTSYDYIVCYLKTNFIKSNSNKHE